MSHLVWLISLFLLYTSPLQWVKGEDPYLFFIWKVSYGIRSPLGVPQQVILINDQFPGPNLNTTTNNNLVINVFNLLDEPLLFTWNGIQQRKNSWQDGMPGTNCPIQPGKNYTYRFQVKDQIGSYFYFPSTAFHKAVGGFGGLRINSRLLIPVPFDPPTDDFTILAGDWYSKNHQVLRNTLDSGRTLGRPHGLLINGQNGKAGDNSKPMFTMEKGLTYRYRVCNVGMKTSFNFRIQEHYLKLVEMDGSHTVQNMYESLDVHVGQCLSFLVTADKEPNDYYMVASTRFLKKGITTTAVIRYANSISKPSLVLPKAPVDWFWSLNQFRSFRWNLTASAARPNPQGSYHYGKINITRTIKIVSNVGTVNGKIRYAINGVSHSNPSTPLKLAEYFGVASKAFKYDAIPDSPKQLEPITIQPIVLNAIFRNFVEIIFENHENGIQSWHLDGYSFFPVGMNVGEWTPESRKNYNMLDAVSRHTIQVYPRSWTAVLLTLDNAGMWNLRSEMWERFYLGQQLYISVVSPARSLRDEYNIPDNFPRCGIIDDKMPLPPRYF